MNLFTYIFLISLLAGILVQWLLVYKHSSCILKNRSNVPDAFSDKISIEAHQKAADYTRAKVKLGLVELIVGSIIIVLWTIGGGLELLDNLWRAYEMSEIITGTIMILSVFAIMAILDLPISLFKIFKLEQSFGFNKMTTKIFFQDLFKSTLMGLVIGTPLILLVLWIMKSSGDYWWVYVWLTWLSFSLLMMWAYPAFIAPFFNKFRELENNELKTRIENLLTRNGFKSNGIFIMDGSTRSTHGNAYFTGLGANKRIVFFDTLIDELSYDEIEAVLAHELGHFKCNHIRKRILLLAIILTKMAIIRVKMAMILTKMTMILTKMAMILFTKMTMIRVKMAIILFTKILITVSINVGSLKLKTVMMRPVFIYLKPSINLRLF